MYLSPNLSCYMQMYVCNILYTINICHIYLKYLIEIDTEKENCSLCQVIFCCKIWGDKIL